MLWFFTHRTREHAEVLLCQLWLHSCLLISCLMGQSGESFISYNEKDSLCGSDTALLCVSIVFAPTQQILVLHFRVREDDTLTKQQSSFIKSDNTTRAHQAHVVTALGIRKMLVHRLDVVATQSSYWTLWKLLIVSRSCSVKNEWVSQ